MKICSVGTEMCHAERQKDKHTGMTKFTVTFHNFAYVPKI